MIKKQKHYDNMDEICERFMAWAKKEFRGYKNEINPTILTKRIKRFSLVYGLGKEDVLLDALLRRGWIEISAGDTWHFRYDLVRR